MQLYGDVEYTGFYDKNKHRWNIAVVLKFLWQSPSHKKVPLSLR